MLRIRGAAMRDPRLLLANRASRVRSRDAAGVPGGSLVARIMAIAIAFALIAPSLFIVCEAHHDCSGDGCQVCQVLAVASSITHAAADVPTGPGTLALACAIAPLTLVASARVGAMTLVGLKVRLDC